MKNKIPLRDKALTIFITLFFIMMNYQALAASTQSQSQPKQTNESWALTQKVKIVKYLLGAVSWPTSSIPENTVHVCVLGKPEKMNYFKVINGNTINNHKIFVRSAINIKDAEKDCQLVYVTDTEKTHTSEIIKAFANKPVLLLADMEHFAQQGGSMNFIDVKGIIALTINIETLKNSHLSFDLKSFEEITVIPSSEDIKD